MPQAIRVEGGPEPESMTADRAEKGKFYFLAAPVYEWRVGDLVYKAADRMVNITRSSYDDRLGLITVRPVRQGERIIIEGN